MCPNGAISVLGIIPARYGSTRFPGKPLIPLLGKPMIQHVYERAKRAKLLSQVVVATDDERIYQAVLGFGGQAEMTSPAHLSGTDRIWETAQRLRPGIVVNIQGDEPGIAPEAIDAACAPVLRGEAELSTLAVRMTDPARFTDPNQVKVVIDQHGFALYFSRAPIPEGALRQSGGYWGHIGLYVYRRETLRVFTGLPPSQLELAERLEQLRALDAGIRIKVVTVTERSPAIDTPDDVEFAERWLNGHA